MTSFFSLFSSAVFKKKSEFNSNNIKYLQGYLRDKEVCFNQGSNTVTIYKGTKPMYKITIEKL